jgi:putative phosphoribosyl transferase
MTVELELRQEIEINTPQGVIRGFLSVPKNHTGMVLFVHGAGSSRFSPRNQHVAEIMQDAGIATLLMDLLSEEEDRIDGFTGKLRFNIPFLAGRVDSATEWIMEHVEMAQHSIGYFGASTGAAAAMVASIQRPEAIGAIVSRGGRPGLADNILAEVKPPTLLIVGGDDPQVLEENQISLKKLTTTKKLIIVRGATHLFEEPGTLDQVAEHAKQWFLKYLISPTDCPHIDDYSFGHITVDGRQFEKDLIILGEDIKDNWWRKDGHSLAIEDLSDVIQYKPDILIVGTGQSGQMKIDQQTKDALQKQGIELIACETAKAVERFNKELQKQTKVAGAFHLTC